MKENIDLARKNLAWVIGMMEGADLEHRKKMAEQGIVVDGELGYIYHLKKVLELLE